MDTLATAAKKHLSATALTHTHTLSETQSAVTEPAMRSPRYGESGGRTPETLSKMAAGPTGDSPPNGTPPPQRLTSILVLVLLARGASLVGGVQQQDRQRPPFILWL